MFREQRAKVRQRRGRDDHAAGVLAGVADEVLELARQVDQVAYVVLVAVPVHQFLRQHGVVAFAHRVLERDAQRHRNELGHAVDEAVGEAEHAAGVAHRRLGRHGAVGDDLADPVAAVLAGDVVDHLVAAVHAEVDVEVGHRHAFGIEEALEQQVVGNRIQIGDAQRPRHQRACARTTSGTHRDAVVLGPVDEVRHDQEVAGEPHAHDDVDFQVQASPVAFFGVPGGHRQFGQATVQAAMRLGADPAFERLIAGHRERRQGVLPQGELEVAALGEGEGVVDGVGDVGEQRLHLVRRLQVLLGAVVARALGIVEHPASGDAHAGLVRVVAFSIEEAYVVAGDHRYAACRGRVQCEGVERILAFALRSRQFQVQVLTEAALQVGQVLLGQFVAPAGGQSRGMALAPDDGEQAAAVAVQPRRVDGDAVGAVALHPCARQQARQGEIAAVVPAQEGQLPRALAALGHADVGACDRLDAHRLGRLVELHQREQVVAIGNRQGGQLEFDGPAQQVGALGFCGVCVSRLLGHADGGIREREFGVQVEVYEARGHAGCRVMVAPVPDKA